MDLFLTIFRPIKTRYDEILQNVRCGDLIQPRYTHPTISHSAQAPRQVSLQTHPTQLFVRHVSKTNVPAISCSPSTCSAGWVSGTYDR